MKRIYEVEVEYAITVDLEDPSNVKRKKKTLVVTADNEIDAKAKARKRVYHDMVWDDDDRRRFFINKVSATELKRRDAVGMLVHTSPECFNKDTEYEIVDYSNGNYCVVSKMWLQRKDFEFVDEVKYKED